MLFVYFRPTCAYDFTRYVSNVPHARGWEKKIAEGPPCVVLASPGFMQTGPSRELFELWAPDSRNGLIITGYSIEGTLARVSPNWFASMVSSRVHHLHVYSVAAIYIPFILFWTCLSAPQCSTTLGL